MSTTTLPSVADEFKTKSFLTAIRAAKLTLGNSNSKIGLSAKSEFELYFQTGNKILDMDILHLRAQNIDIRYSKIRSVYWKIFLSYIPNNTSLWSKIISAKRQQFIKLKEKYMSNIVPENEQNLVIDNPLASTAGGTWDKFFEDKELQELIELDINRTYPDSDFFSHPFIQKALTNILFIYAKENTWILYKQGMNELLATLLMVNTIQSTISAYVETDDDINDDANDGQLWEEVQDIQYIEHDTYYMFVELMSVMGQYFVNTSGSSVPPVVERCHRIQGQFLRQMDSQLARYLTKVNITPQLYGLRWIRLFFSREFHLRDVCVVWDSIFGAYSDRKHMRDEQYSVQHKIYLDFRFVDYMACSMLLFIRHQLLGRDQQHCLRRVMRYPPIEDISLLIVRAYTIRDHIERRGKFAKNKHRNRSKHLKNIDNTFDFSNRWTTFSKTVSHAMNTYAEDVKSLIGGKRRTLKSRMQFEKALGNKMDEVLERLQNAVNFRRDEMSSITMSTENADCSTSDVIDEQCISTEIVDEIKIECIDDEIQIEEFIDPLSADVEFIDNDMVVIGNGKEKDVVDSNDKTVVEVKEGKVETLNPLLMIEEAVAELKLVKDALLGNLDEVQLESWLDWEFVEPSPDPPLVIIDSSHHQRHSKKSKYKKKRKSLTSSGLPRPRNHSQKSKKNRNNF